MPSISVPRRTAAASAQRLWPGVPPLLIYFYLILQENHSRSDSGRICEATKAELHRLDGLRKSELVI